MTALDPAEEERMLREAGFAVDAVRDHGKARLHLLRYTAEGKA